MKTPIVALAAAAACTAAANASITYNSQYRFVEKTATLFSGPYASTLNNFTLNDWDVEINGGFSDAEGSADAYATQISSLGDNYITASGIAGGSIGPPAGSSYGTGRTAFSIAFIISEPVDYTLELSVWGEYVNYSFTGPSLSLAGGNSTTETQSGTLAAGDYNFVLELAAGGFFGEGYFDFNFQIVPAPATASLMGLGLLAATRRRR